MTLDCGRDSRVWVFVGQIRTMDQLACFDTRLQEENALKGLRCSNGSCRMLVHAKPNGNEPNLLNISPVDP
jgi:hypothetical protein